MVCGLHAQQLYDFRTSSATTPVPTGPGPFAWETNTNWVFPDGTTPPTSPDGAGTLVNIESDVASSGTATVTLSTQKTVGFLALSDFNNNGIFVLAQAPSTSGNLVFDGGGARAFLNNFISQSTLSFPVISVPISISNGGNPNTGILDVNIGLNGNFMTTISGTVTGGSILKTGGGALKLTGTYTPGTGGNLTVAMRGFGDAGTISNATQNSNLILANPVASPGDGGASLKGNLVIGNASRGGTGSAVVTLGGNEQIIDTAIVSFDGTSGNNPYFKLAGFTETVGGISDYTAQGVIENSENEATNVSGANPGFGTLKVNVASGTTQFYNGFIRDKNTVSTNGVNFVKMGAGTQILSGGNISFTGTLDVQGGTLQLINTTNATFLSAQTQVTLSGGGTLAFENTSTTAWTFAKNIVTTSGVGNLSLIGNPATTTGTITINLTGNISLNGGILTATQHQSAITAYNLTGNNSFGNFKLTAPNTGINATLTFGATVATNVVTFTQNATSDIIGPSATVDFRTAATWQSGGTLNVVRSDVLLQPNADTSLVTAGGSLNNLTTINLVGNTTDTTFSILNDNSTNGRQSGNRVTDSTAINSKGGKIIFGEVGGGGSVNQSETLGVLTLQAGDLEISTSNLSAGTSRLTFTGSLSHTVGATINFSGASLGALTNQVAFTTQGSTTFLGGWATAGTEWASYVAGTGANTGVLIFGSGAPGAGTYTTNAFTATQNIKLTASTNPTGSGTLAINSLNLQGSTIATTIPTGLTLNVSSGGILASGGTSLSIGATGTGNITSSSGELDVWVPTAGQLLTISAPITGAGVSVVKAGLGSLVLNGANTYGGKTFINQGTLQVNADSGLGGPPALTPDSITMDGGTLRFGSTMTLNANRGITLLGGGGTLQVDSGASPTFTPQVVTYAGKITANTPGGVFTWNGSQITTATNPGGVFNLTSTGNDFSAGFETVSGTTVGTVDNSAFNITSAGSNNTFGRVRIFGSSVNIGQSASPTTNTFSGDILMSGGSLTLAGNIQFTNPNGTLITLALGNLSLGAANTAVTSRNVANVTSAGPLNLNLLSGQFALAGNNLTINELAGSGTAQIGNFFNADATLTINQNSNTTYTGFITDGTFNDVLNSNPNAISNPLNIVKTGSGNLTLNNPANSFSGVVTIAGGTLTVLDLSVFGNSSLGAGGFATSSASSLVLTTGGALRFNGATEAFTLRSFTLGTGQDAGSIIADGTSRNAKLHMGVVDVSSGITASEDVAFTGSGARTLTLGGFNQGDNEFNLVLGDGTGGATSLNKTGNGTWVLTQASSYSGLTTVSGGVLAVSVDGALGSTAQGTMLMGGPSIQSFAVGGVLDLRNVQYNTAETLFMDGGELVVTQGNSSWAGNVNISVNSNIQVTGGDSLNLKGTLTGNGAINFLGEGTLTLSGNTTARDTSLATMTVVAGTLVLDYSVNNTRKLSNSATLVLGGSRLGGTVVLSGGSIHETVGALSLQAGVNTITRTSGSSVIDLNVITVAAGGLLNISAPDIATTDTGNKAGGLTLGAWATVGGNDWAVNSNSGSPGGITFLDSITPHNNTFIRGLSQAVNAGPNSGYNDNVWGTVATGNVTIANTNITTSQTANANNTWTLRYNTAGSFTVTLPGATTIFTGGIMNTAAVGNNDNFIKGGSLSAGTGTTGNFPNQEMIIYQNNPNGSLIISSNITNNPLGGTNGLNKAGPGTLILTGSNTYTGVTTLNDGVVSINSFGPTGFANATGIASTDTLGNTLVFGSSVGLTIGQQILGGSGVVTGPTNTIVAIPDAFHYVMSQAATSSNTATTITFSPTGAFGGTLAGATTVAGSNIVTVTSMTGIVMGASVSGVGIPDGSYITGILDSTHYIINNTATLSSPGTVSLNYGSNASGLGAATNAVGNVFLNGGTLQYTGNTAFTDRGFTLNFSSTISVTDPNTTLRMTNVLNTGGSFGDYVLTKQGEGTLAFTDSTSGGYGITGYNAAAGRLQLYMAFGNDRVARNDVATLTLSGGAFEIVGDTLASRSQTIPGQLTLNAGTSEVKVTSQLGVTTTLNIQNAQDLLSVVRNPGSAVRFVENGGSLIGVANIELFNTIDLTGVAIPFAVFKDTLFNNDTQVNSQPGVQDLAFINPSNGDVIAADSGSAYKIAANAASWGTIANPWVTSYFTEASTSFNGNTQNQDVHIQLLRYFNRGSSLVNITNRLTLDDGAIMIAANIGNNTKEIAGPGILTSGYGHGFATNDLIIHNYNYSAPFKISATIGDYQMAGFTFFLNNGSNQMTVGAGSPSTTGPVANIALLDVGMTITAAGLPVGTKITAIDLGLGVITLSNPSSQTSAPGGTSGSVAKSVNLLATGQSVTKETNNTVISQIATNGTPTSGSFILPVNSTAGLVVGMQAVATGIPLGATVTAIGPGNQVTLSLAATSTQPTLAVNFYLVSPVTHTDAWVGTTILSGTNTYTGTTYVEGGVLRLDSAGAIPGGIAATGTSHIIIDGGVIGLTAAGGDFTRGLGTGVSQVEFTGSGGFAAYGSDRIVNFGGSNAQLRWDYGNFLINDSTLILGAPDATNMVTVTNPIDLGPLNRYVRVDNGTAAIDGTLSGILSSDGGGLVKFGFGTLALTGANSYTGGTVVAAGNLVGNNPANAFGTGAIGLGTTSDSDVDDKVALTLGAGTLPAGNSITVGSANYQSITSINNTASVAIAGTVTLNKQVFLNAASGTSMTLNGAVSGTAGLTVIGGGNVVLGASNSYGTAANTLSGAGIDGGTVIRSGTVHIAAATNALGASTVELGDATTVATLHVFRATNTTSISMKGGIFDATGNALGPNQGGPGAFVNISNTVDGYTFQTSDADGSPGDGTGKRILVKDDDGSPERNGVYRVVSVDTTNNVMTLVRDTDFSTTANMVYGYQVVVDGGTSTGVAYFMAAPSVTNVNGQDTDPTAWLVDTVNPNVALLSDITGGAVNNKIDVNATNGTGTSTIGGASTLTVGTSSFNGAITLQDLLAGIAENKTLFLASSTITGDGITFSGVISEADGGAFDTLAITTTNSGVGPGIVTVSGNNGYHGVTTIASGTALRAENNNALGFGNGSAANGTVVNNGGELQISGVGIAIGNEALTLNGTGFSATGALHNISGANSYGGAITLATASEITANASSSLTLTSAATITSIANAGLTFGGAGTVTANGVITLGTGTLTKADAGTAILTTANVYSGQTFINQGILQIQNNTALGATGAGSNTVVSTGGELDLVGTPTALTINENISLSGSGASSGGALHNVTGNNSYTGPITLAASATIGADSGTTLTVNTGATAITSTGAADLTVTGAGNTTITNVIGNTGNLNKTGSGVLALNNTGTQTYTGTTSVTGGALQVGVAGTGSTNANTISVSGTGTLAGTGTVRGITTIGSGGTLAPGDTGGTSLGTLNFASGANVTFTSGSFAVFQVNNTSPTQGTQTNDFVNVTGSLTLNTGMQFQLVDATGGFNANAFVGEVINLLDWGSLIPNSFNVGTNGRTGGNGGGDLYLPTLTNPALTYDVSQFLTNGQIIIAAPEPGRMLLLAFGGFAALMRRRRKTA